MQGPRCQVRDGQARQPSVELLRGRPGRLRRLSNSEDGTDLLRHDAAPRQRVSQVRRRRIKCIRFGEGAEAEFKEGEWPREEIGTDLALARRLSELEVKKLFEVEKFRVGAVLEQMNVHLKWF